ncbi:hypothetical protein [Wolbachia endosymbiont of Folsomia candida]|uniref:hypothetical protein n=1 Tax=Wolbachia endosymbiont of Folsomia candida TaxID=169402 RepID=UPI0013006BC4|nr:hypothetical protein [Wolbachia endosymbiont of Folsomia candida]
MVIHAIIIKRISLLPDNWFKCPSAPLFCHPRLFFVIPVSRTGMTGKRRTWMTRESSEMTQSISLSVIST